MKKICLVGGGDVTVTLPKDEVYVGVDKGVEALLQQGIKPIYAIGDFDSIESLKSLKDLDIDVLPRVKDVTDTHAAVDYAIEHGYSDIDLYGVTGKRLDHFMAVMCLLELYQQVHIRIIDEYNIIELLKPGTHVIKHSEYKYFSIYALSESYLDIRGAHYNLDHYLLKREDPLCCSNQVDDEAVITNSDNIILIYSH